MSDTYRTYGKISSVSIRESGNSNESLQMEIEIDFETNYRVEFKDDGKDKPQIFGVGQSISENASFNSHKIIDSKFLMKSSLENIALSAMEKNRIVVLDYILEEIQKKVVFRIKVK